LLGDARASTTTSVTHAPMSESKPKLRSAQWFGTAD